MIPEIAYMKYHPFVDDIMRLKLEYIEAILESNDTQYRHIISKFHKICELNQEYRDDLELYVYNETNKWIRMFNLFMIDVNYDRCYNRALKKFLETMKKF